MTDKKTAPGGAVFSIIPGYRVLFVPERLTGIRTFDIGAQAFKTL
jgi:hypothetical protein